MIGWPKLGASDSRTVRGTTVRITLSPKCSRTSRTTWSASFVRASYITQTIVLTVQRRVQVASDQIDVAEQLAETLQGVVLALDRDEHLRRGGQTR